MTSLDIVHRPLDEVVELIRSGDLSAVALMRFVIDRTKRIHSQLNVIVDERFDDALEDAAKLQQMLSRGEAKDLPLLGLPFSVKSNISLKGLRLDMGSWSMHGQRAPSTATAIDRLIKAGAIPVCTTNISEMGLWHDAVNPIYGRTLNPWKKSLMVGGSSGGEAALIAAGGTLFGIGTDLDGSIRIAASFCGLFGHKPSRGIVPLTGQFPFFKPEDEIPWRALDSIGPLTRHASDLGRILEIIAGPCPFDPMSMTGTIRQGPIDLPGKRVALISHPTLKGQLRSSPAIRLAMHKTKQRLTEAGVEWVEGPRDLFYDGFQLWRLMIHRAVEARMSSHFRFPNRRQSAIEVLKWLTGQSDHSLQGCFLKWVDPWILQPDQLRSLDAELGMLKRRFDALFQTVDAIVLPVYPQLAPLYQASLLQPMNLGLTGLANVFGLPATSAPVGIASGGSPVGVQIISRTGNDLLTISLADTIGEFIPSPHARTN